MNLRIILSSKRRIQPWILLSFVYWIITILYIPQGFLDLGGDSAQYIILAENLAQGKGLRMANYPNEPLSPIAPLLPVLLSPILYSFGRNIFLLHLFVLLLAYGALALFYRIFTQKSSRIIALLTIAFLATNRLFLSCTNRILTEIPFLFFSGFSLFFFDKYKSRQSFLNKDGFLLSAALILTYLCRYIGMLLFFIFLLDLLLDKKEGKKGAKKIFFLLFTFTPVVFFWYLRNLRIDNAYFQQFGRQFFLVNIYSPYLGVITLRDVIFRFIEGVNFYLIVITNALFPYFLKKLPLPIYRDSFLMLALTIIFIGLWVKVKENSRSHVFYFLIYLASIVFWPYYEDGRYLICILPFIFFYFFVGLSKLLSFAPGKTGFYFLPVLSLCLLLFNNLSFPMIRHSYENLNQPFKNFVSLHIWIERNLPGQELIISRKPTVTYFFTNHKSMGYPFALSPDEVWQALSKHNAKYIIVDEFSKETYYYLSPFLYKYKNRLTLLYRIGDTGLFKITE